MSKHATLGLNPFEFRALINCRVALEMRLEDQMKITERGWVGHYICGGVG